MVIRAIYTLVLIVVVILGGYLAWTLMPEEVTEPEEEVIQDNSTPAEPVTAQELEAMQEIQRLAARKSKEDIPAFKQHLNDESPHVRHAAAKAIIDVGGRDELPALLKVLKDPDHGVRAGIIQFLAQWRDRRMVPHLGEVLRNDEVAGVRVMAVHALREINDESCIPVLIDALNDRMSLVRKKAHEALMVFYGRFTQIPARAGEVSAS